MPTGDLVLPLVKRMELARQAEEAEQRHRELDGRIDAAMDSVDAGRISRPEPWPDDPLGGE